MNWIKVSDRLPEPGVPVLLCVEMQRGYPMKKTVRKVIRAYHVPKHTWNVDDHPYLDIGEYDERTDTYYYPEGFYEQNEYEETHWRVVDKAVCWMPMPAVPSGRKKALLKTYSGEGYDESLTREIEVDEDWHEGDDIYGDKVHEAVGSNQTVREIPPERCGKPDLSWAIQTLDAELDSLQGDTKRTGTPEHEERILSVQTALVVLKST